MTNFQFNSDFVIVNNTLTTSSPPTPFFAHPRQVLELYCASQGWTFEIVSALGSGMNYHKKGLRKLLEQILDGSVGRLVLTHKDRLLRFGAELVFALCEAKEVEVVIINKGEDATFEEDLAKDVLEIITVFSARLYGSRSRKNQKIIIPNLGWVRMRESLRFVGKIVSATISRTAQRWFVSITVETPEKPMTVGENQAAVGVDLGVETMATLSTGEKVEGTKPHKSYITLIY